MAGVCIPPNELAASSPAVTIHIVDDNCDIRHTAAFLVRSTGLAAEEHASALEFLEQYDPEKPGCVVLDIDMPGMSGLELQEILNATEVPPPIIFVTGHAEVPHAVKAIRGGAIDLIIKPFRAETLFERIREAVNLDLANRRKHALSGDTRSLLARLTARESQIAKLLSAGESVKHIAHDLGISAKTVENHRARVLEKLSVDNPTQLAHLLAKLE